MFLLFLKKPYIVTIETFSDVFTRNYVVLLQTQKPNDEKIFSIIYCNYYFFCL